MNLRISWGTGIFIAFALFMAFILFFVFTVQSDSSYDNELVVEDYYKQERVLQERLDKEQNAAELQHKLQIINTQGAVKIIFPEEFDPKLIQGKVSLYRPSAQQLDFEIPISLSAPYLLIPKSGLAGGRWDIIVEWQYKEQKYLNKQMLNL